MLPIMNLDDENYQEIFLKARNKIAAIYPQWTDYNEHDPGITFLQLFSWMKEMQQFHLDQIGTKQWEMYLKILGMEQKRKEPARTLVKISGFSESFVLPKGTRFFAGEIPFETEKVERMESMQLLECLCISGNTVRKVGSSILKEGNRMRLYPFGETPKPGNLFLMKFDRKMEPGEKHAIYFDIFEDYPVERNPIEGEFYSLAKMEIEYYGESGFSPCIHVKDDTYEFLQDGVIEFEIPKEMKPLEDGSYGIRFRLVEGEYDIPPVIQEIMVNVVKVSQKQTLADYQEVSLSCQEDGWYHWESHQRIFIQGDLEVYEKTEQGLFPLALPEEQLEVRRQWNQIQVKIKSSFSEADPLQREFFIVGYDKEWKKDKTFFMNGLPYQKISFHDKELLYQGMELIGESATEKGLWEKWEKVPDFHCSTPEHRHYCFEEEEGSLLFGDCEQGLAPEGAFRVIRYIRSYGSRGDVRKNQIRKVENKNLTLEITNEGSFFSGREKERIEECFQRFGNHKENPKRAITPKDYEKIVVETPGLMIQRVKAVPTTFLEKGDGGDCMSIVVQPFSRKEKAVLSQAYIKNIAYVLEKKRLIGTKIRIMSPVYVGITVFVDILVKSHYPTAKDMVKHVVKEYFENSNLTFGTTIEESELYGKLDALECVLMVRNLAVHAQGPGVKRMANGNITLPIHGLCYLKQADYTIGTEDV